MESSIKYFDLKTYNDSFEPELSQAVQAVVSSGWYLLGSNVERFEQEFAAYCGVKQCIGTANGLDALVLTLTAWKEMGFLDEGDEVLVPANTYIATILAIVRCNLKPVLVEPDPCTFNLDATQIEAHLSAKSKVLLPVHLYGRCADMTALNVLASKYKLLVLEDAAQAHGSRIDSGIAGSLGNAAGFSFYPSKNLGCLGDGGCVTTNDSDLADCVRSLANYGSQKKYVNKYRGINSRLDELHAAVLSVKLKRLDADNAKRRMLAQAYASNIQNDAVALPQTIDFEASNFHVFPVLSEFRNQLQVYLNQHNIETLIHYPIPPHKQEAFKNLNHLHFPITEQIHRQELSLPISPMLNAIELDRICQTIHQFKP